MSTPRISHPRAIAICLLALVWLSVAGLAHAQDVALTLRLTPEQVKQGGVTAIRIQGTLPAEPLRLRVGNREIPLDSPNAGGLRTVWIGVDLEQRPGPLDVAVEGMTSGGRRLHARASIRVLDAGYPVQRLTVARSFTELDAATLQRATREKAIEDRLWQTVTATRFWRGPFRSPLENGVRGTGFGLKRIINGEPRAPHTGIDFSVPAGTTVLAANAGVVVLDEEHFFAGKSLVLDHGEGLYTMYFHLQDSVAPLGQQVSQGDRIGHVGSTGRATGPHLHWGARLNGARIDPEELLRLPTE